MVLDVFVVLVTCTIQAMIIAVWTGQSIKRINVLEQENKDIRRMLFKLRKDIQRRKYIVQIFPSDAYVDELIIDENE